MAQLHRKVAAAAAPRSVVPAAEHPHVGDDGSSLAGPFCFKDAREQVLHFGSRHHLRKDIGHIVDRVDPLQHDAALLQVPEVHLAMLVEVRKSLAGYPLHCKP